MAKKTKYEPKFAAGTKKKRSVRPINILIAIGATAIAVCAFGFVRDTLLRKHGQNFYSALTSEASATGETAAKPNLSDLLQTPAPTASAAPGATAAPTEGVSEADKWKYESFVDFDKLKKANSDIVAWIKLDGTIIDYPVYQGSDNEFYLHHLPDKTYNFMGSIFMDYRNTPDFSDQNTVFYGHNLETGDMFTALTGYKEQKFYDDHPVYFIYTPARNYAVAIFAGYVLDSSKEAPPLIFRTEKLFNDYIAAIKNRSTFTSDVDVSWGDKLVTLATCANGYDSYRFIIVGKLIE